MSNLHSHYKSINVFTKDAPITVRPSSTGPSASSVHRKIDPILYDGWKKPSQNQVQSIPISSTLNQYPFAPIEINAQSSFTEPREQRLRAINGNTAENPRSAEGYDLQSNKRQPDIPSHSPINVHNNPQDTQQVYLNQNNNFNIIYRGTHQQRNTFPQNLQSTTVRPRENQTKRGDEIFNYFNGAKEEQNSRVDGRLSEYIRIDEVK